MTSDQQYWIKQSMRDYDGMLRFKVYDAINDIKYLSEFEMTWNDNVYGHFYWLELAVTRNISRSEKNKLLSGFIGSNSYAPHLIEHMAKWFEFESLHMFSQSRGTHFVMNVDFVLADMNRL